ncbi:hypothetical protein [Myxococcus qinghaiensis]|uniref:hypothetical protein n=1 Tax=Myxococcus qinghaiensis TaxID=2906758 RepID=UPI0020A7ADDB|nr:hypothetical protein [Myxococcus qinghaiensis]MCP3166415.1 hypothetical protein [Myxococcus qinghaiensis]
MELDDFQKCWQANDARLDEVIRLNRRMLRATELEGTRTAMARVRMSLGFELVMGLVSLVALGAFIAANVREPRFVVPALLLHGVALVLTAISGRQWLRVGSLDYAAPITQLQTGVESLRLSTVRTTQWVLWLSPLLWTPLLIVGLRGVAGVDAWRALGTGYLAANVLFGLVFLALMVVGSRWLTKRPTGAAWLQRLAHAVAGTNLNAAREQLARLAAFEESPRGAGK